MLHFFHDSDTLFVELLIKHLFRNIASDKIKHREDEREEFGTHVFVADNCCQRGFDHDASVVLCFLC